jgi:hypothetical protein
MSNTKSNYNREVPKLSSSNDEVDWATFQFRIRTLLAGKKRADRVIGAKCLIINEDNYHKLFTDYGQEFQRSEDYLFELARRQKTFDS